MENCLITKLNVIIDNESLPKLGVLRFTIKANSTISGALCSVQGEESILSIVSGKGFTIKNTSTSEPVSIPWKLPYSTFFYTYTTENEDVVLEISNKYALTYFRILQIAEVIDTKEIKYLYNLKDTSNANLKGDIANIPFNNLNSFTIKDTSLLYGNIEVFEKYINALSPNLIVTNAKLTGNFGKVANNINSIKISENIINYPIMEFNGFLSDRTKMLFVYKADLSNTLENYLSALENLDVPSTQP